jgi:hypothetical protein
MLEQARKAGYRTAGVGRIKQLYKKISGAMESGLTAHDPALVPVWRTLNQQVARNKNLYENAGIVKLAKLGTKGSVAGTERFAQAIFRPGEVTGAQRVMDAIGVTEAGATLRQRMKWSLTNHLLKQSLGEGGVVDGAKLLRNIQSPQHYSEASATILSAAERMRLTQYATQLKKFQALRQEAPGGESFGLMRAAAVVGILSGTLPPKAAAIMIAPNVAARMVTNPLIFRSLIGGTQPMGASSRALAQLSGRLSVEVARILNQEQEDEASRAETWAAPPDVAPTVAATPVPAKSPRPTMSPFRVPRGSRPAMAGQAR